MHFGRLMRPPISIALFPDIRITPIELIPGGVADAAMGLYRERGQSGATLKISGRDLIDQELAVDFNAEIFTWQLIGTAAGVRTETLQHEIMNALDELGGSGTISEVANWLKKDKSNIRKEVLELVDKGVISREEKVGREVPYRLIN